MKPSAFVARGNSSEDAAGVSISFDPQALQEEEEAELAREEQQRQHELQALLSRALDDGLTDDEDDDDDEEGEVSQATFDPDISSEISSVSDQPPHMLWPNQGGAAFEDFKSDNHEAVVHGPPSQDPYLSAKFNHGGQQNRYYQNFQTVREAKNTSEQGNYYNNTQGDHIPGMYSNSAPSRPRFPKSRETSVPGIKPADESNRYAINSDPNVDRRTAEFSGYPIITVPNSSNQHHISEENLEEYQVKYRGKPKTSPPSAAVNDVEAATHPDLRTLQEDLINAGGMSENSRLGQLQILYNARGRKIEELDNQLKQLHDDSGREIRILKHKMALMQDEKAGVEGSLQQCQNLLSDNQERENKLQGKVKALEATIQTLQDAKTELVRKLQTAESSVESLSSQLIELGSSDSLARARQHHESAVGALQRKYDTEIITLKEKLDQQSQINFEKSNEVSHLKKQIELLRKSAEEAQISKADTINRLTRSLEESQRQCQQLLECNSGQESSRLKIQLQEAVAAKSISEDLNNALQDEMKDLKEQLTIYESASAFGILPSGMTSTPATQQYSAEDSFAQLGLRKARTPVDFNTPDSVGDTGKLSKEESVASLKNELERCVNMYRNKRHQVSLLQEELRVVRNTNQQKISELQDLEQQFSKAKEQLKDYEEIKKLMETGAGSYKEAKFQRQVDDLLSEREDLLDQIKNLENRVEEIADSESQTKEFNRELSAQMAEMVHQFDEDKRQALLSCEEAMNSHFESLKEAWREENKKEFEQEKEHMEEIRNQIKFELEETRNELDEVKELYVKACNEKDELEAQLNKEWEERLAQDLEKVKAQLKEDQLKQVENLKEKLSSESEMTIESAREKWLKEQEQTLKDKIETEIVLAKTLWAQEHKEEKDAAVKSAIEETAEKWLKKLDEEIQLALHEAEKKWANEQEKNLKEKLEEAHAEWRRNELPKFLENNRSSPKTSGSHGSSNSEWHIEKMKLMQSMNEEKKLAVQEARKQLDEDYKMFMAEHKEALNRALKTAQGQSEKEKQDLISKYENMIKALKEQRDSEHHSMETAEEIEQKWKAKVEEIQQQHERDKEEQAASHRETLYKALEEARHRWQTKFEEAMAEQEVEWNMDREKMLREAEDHVETECQRLHQQHQDEMQQLQARHEKHLERALNQLREELQENDFSDELGQMRHQMQRHEDQFNEELAQLKQELEEKEEQVQEMQQELHKVQMKVVEQREEYEHRLEKTEVQKQEAISAYSQSEKEHAHMIKSYKTRLSEMGDKLHRMENKLKAAGTGTQMQLQALQESMEREYSVAMKKMKEKMLEMQQQHTSDEEPMKRKRSACTQTLESSPTSETLQEMRSYYLDMITNIRKDVIQHVSKSNEEAANKVRQEVLKERHFTAKRLKRYCMKSLSKMLENFDGEDKNALMDYMEQMLHNMPEKDSSCSSVSSKQGFRSPGTLQSQSSSAALSGSQGDRHAAQTQPTLTYQSALQSDGYPSFSKRNQSPNSTPRTDSTQTYVKQYDQSYSHSGTPSSRGNTKPTSQSLQGSATSASSGPPFVQHQRPISSSSNHQEDAEDAMWQMLSTEESVASSAASVAWATPSELLLKLSPQHRLMLEQNGSLSKSTVTGLSPPTTDKGQKSSQKFYKLDLQILDSDRHITNSEQVNMKQSNLYNNANREEISGTKQTSRFTSLPRSGSRKGSDIALHGSPGMQDVRGRSHTKVSTCTLSKANSDDCLNNSNTEVPHRKPMTSTELRNLTFRRPPKVGHLQGVGYLGSPPSKSQSMPNVADVVTVTDCDDSTLRTNERDRSSRKMPTSHYQHDNSFTQYRESSAKNFHSMPTQPKKPHYSSSKKEGCRVSFKNVDLDTTDTSDESVKSFCSTSSVSGFREALKTRRSHVRSNGLRPYQVTATVNFDEDEAVKALHRPIALVTRHTQVPSPLPSKRK